MRGAAYMTTLQALKRACDRELDEIQGGGVPTTSVGDAFAAVSSAKRDLQDQIRREPGRRSPNVS